MSSVALQSIRKSYGMNEVIHNVDIDISEGEFMVLVGPSGCGKSTLLRMVAGLESVTSGEIRFDGNVVNDLSPKRRNIAMVFQNYALYPHMTVRENISLNLRLSRIKKEEINRRVEVAVRLLDIGDIMDRYPAQLSGGQRQRVAMGRAIVRDPRVFLFDEPLSNLDAKLRVAMRTEIKALHQQVRTTSLYVTHDQIEAMMLADRIAVMNAGHIEQIGSPIELYNDPVNRFVAGFIGSPAMNFIPGHIVNGCVAIADAQKTLPKVKIDQIPEGAAVTVGLRPEHFFLSSLDDALPATIRQIDPTGSQTYMVANVLDHHVTVILDGMVRFTLGEKVGLGINVEDIYVFADDERTLKGKDRGEKQLWRK